MLLPYSRITQAGDQDNQNRGGINVNLVGTLFSKNLF